MARRKVHQLDLTYTSLLRLRERLLCGASPYAADDLDDELWGEPPDGVVRKSAAKLDDQR